MKNIIEERLNATLISAENRFEEDSILEDFKKTIEEFESLVSKGLASKRGNNSFSRIQSTSQSIKFNR